MIFLFVFFLFFLGAIAHSIISCSSSYFSSKSYLMLSTPLESQVSVPCKYPFRVYIVYQTQNFLFFWQNNLFYKDAFPHKNCTLRRSISPELSLIECGQNIRHKTQISIFVCRYFVSVHYRLTMSASKVLNFRPFFENVYGWVELICFRIVVIRLLFRHLIFLYKY